MCFIHISVKKNDGGFRIDDGADYDVLIGLFSTTLIVALVEQGKVHMMIDLSCLNKRMDFGIERIT